MIVNLDGVVKDARDCTPTELEQLADRYRQTAERYIASAEGLADLARSLRSAA